MSVDKLFKWFKHNQMKCSRCRYHLTILTLLTRDSKQVQTENSLIKFGVKFDHQLAFDQHVNGLCKKANTKLKAFLRVLRYMGLVNKKLKMNSFLLPNSIIIR